MQAFCPVQEPQRQNKTTKTTTTNKDKEFSVYMGYFTRGLMHQFGVLESDKSIGYCMRAGS